LYQIKSDPQAIKRNNLTSNVHKKHKHKHNIMTHTKKFNSMIGY
jgi:hypothetical protein